MTVTIVLVSLAVILAVLIARVKRVMSISLSNTQSAKSKETSELPLKELSKSGSNLSNDFGNFQIQYSALKIGEKIGRGAAGEVFRFDI